MILSGTWAVTGDLTSDNFYVASVATAFISDYTARVFKSPTYGFYTALDSRLLISVSELALGYYTTTASGRGFDFSTYNTGSTLAASFYSGA